MAANQLSPQKWLNKRQSIFTHSTKESFAPYFSQTASIIRGDVDSKLESAWKNSILIIIDWSDIFLLFYFLQVGERMYQEMLMTIPIYGNDTEVTEAWDAVQQHVSSVKFVKAK